MSTQNVQTLRVKNRVQRLVIFCGLSFSAVLASALVGRAAPLDTKAVASGAVWVAHVDVDALRNSYVVKKVFETCPIVHERAPAVFDKLKERIGMDLRKDLHGITLYGKDTNKEHAVMIVYAEVISALLIEKAEKARDYKATKYGDGELKIRSWSMQHDGKTHTAAGAFFNPNIMVFASTPEAVADAMDVLNIKEKPLASDSPLATTVLPGTTLLLRATAVDPKTDCPVLAQASAFRVAMGEHDGKSFYRANVTMKSHEAADEIGKINDGFRALITLRHGTDADVMKLVNGFKTTVDGTVLKIRWDASAADVWAVVEKASAKISAHIGKAAKHGEGKKSTDDDF